MDHPLPWLKYIDAGDLGDSSLSFDGMKVESTSAEGLGKVDGFIIDGTTGRPYHVVVDAGGWFKSKFFLVPVGHAALDLERKRLVTDVSRDHVSRYPGFDRGEFEKLTDADLHRMNEEIAAACCPGELGDGTAVATFETWTHYREPSWWDAEFYRPDRVEGNEKSMAGTDTKKPL